MGLVSASGGTASNAGTTNTSFSLTPTRNAGDLVIVHCHLGDSGKTIAEPAGWSVGDDDGGPEAGAQAGIWYKQILANESGSLSWSWTGGTSYVAGCLRFTSNSGNRVLLEQFTSSSTPTDNASPYTTSSITMGGGGQRWLACGISCEGNDAATFASNVGGDVRQISVSNTNATEESLAMFSSDAGQSGSQSRTLTASANTQFHAQMWIAEIVETGWTRSLLVNNTAAINRSYYW